MNHWTEKQLVAESPNVERLPTAKSKRVCNHRFAEQRRAACKMKRDSGAKERFGFIQPFERRYLERARRIKSILRSPELAVINALLITLDRDIRERALNRLEVAVAEGQTGEDFLQAVEIVRHTLPMTNGDVAGMNAAYAALVQEVCHEPS